MLGRLGLTLIELHKEVLKNQKLTIIEERIKWFCMESRLVQFLFSSKKNHTKIFIQNCITSVIQKLRV